MLVQKVRVQQDDKGGFAAVNFDGGMTPKVGGSLFNLEVSGPSPIKLPQSLANYDEVIRWQVRLLDEGYSLSFRN